MLLSSFIFAFGAVLFKAFSLGHEFYATYIYSQLGGFLLGVFLFVGIRKYRINFFSLMKVSNYKFILWNLSNESISLLGSSIMYYCYVVLLAPTSLVQAILGIQPLIIIVIGISCSRLLPKVLKENLDFKNILQKSVWVFILLIGVGLIFI